MHDSDHDMHDMIISIMLNNHLLESYNLGRKKDGWEKVIYAISDDVPAQYFIAPGSGRESLRRVVVLQDLGRVQHQM